MDYNEIHEERIRAHLKHGGNSLESGNRFYEYDDRAEYVPRWDEKQNRILVEEIGEISKAMNDFALGSLSREEYEKELRGELVQSMAVLAAWVDKLDGPLPDFIAGVPGGES